METTAVDSNATGASKLRMLTEVMREVLRVRRYARRTEETYVGWVRDFIRFHRGRHKTRFRERETVVELAR